MSKLFTKFCLLCYLVIPCLSLGCGGGEPPPPTPEQQASDDAQMQDETDEAINSGDKPE